MLRESVMLVVRDYNTILDALSLEDRRLFAEHLRRLDRKISPGLGKLTWADKHIKVRHASQCKPQTCTETAVTVRFADRTGSCACAARNVTTPLTL